ncbi:MAG: FkbM family methyltransferase [Candidatus Kapabacteria bacterium]|nr:FkbM family methyltransferase [Candidatus Kapabacteria bacterium]
MVIQDTRRVAFTVHGIPLRIRKGYTCRRNLHVMALDSIIAPVTAVTGRFRRLHLFLRRLYRALPTSIRGERMVHDHLRSVVRRRREQTFMLIGANDGVMADHVYDHASRYRWHGVAVEPVPSFFRALRAHYAGLPVQLLNIAVHHQERAMRLYYIDAEKGRHLPAWARGVGSFDRNQVVQATAELPDAASCITSIDVPCRTLDEIVSESALPRVDIIVVDVEGYDHEVVSRIRFDEWKTHTVVFEYKHIPTPLLDDLLSLLQRHGFSVQRDHEDILAHRLL